MIREPMTVPMGYDEAGEGPTVVALHGGITSGRLTFGPVRSSWAKRLRVLLPDRRGFERTPAPGPGTIAEQAEDLLAFIDVHGRADPGSRRPRAHVVGASLGGVIALTALQFDPGAFRSITLLEAPALSLAPDDPEMARWRDELEDLWPWATPLSPSGVRHTGVPALVCSGEHSWPRFRGIGHRIAEVLKAEHRIIPGTGHALQLAGRRLLDPLRAHIAHAEAHGNRSPTTVAPPDGAWAARAAEEQSVLRAELGALVHGIEHIGSTAVPGLAAKPVIDLMLGVRDLDADATTACPRIEAVGYSWWRANPRAAEHAYLLRACDGVRTHHVHVTTHGSRFWHERLAFRDALRADPELAASYEQLKRELAARFPDDREAYTDGKARFVERVLSRAG